MTRWSADLTAGQIEAMSRRNRAARVTLMPRNVACPACQRTFPTEQSVKVHFGHQHQGQSHPWPIKNPEKLGTMGAAGRAIANARKRDKPGYERRLIAQLEESGISGMVPEYRFHETRKWRIDVAFPEQKLAVEIDGAVHRIKERFHSDIEKHQALLFAGWRLLRVSTKQVRNGEAVKAIKGVMA